MITRTPKVIGRSAYSDRKSEVLKTATAHKKIMQFSMSYGSTRPLNPQPNVTSGNACCGVVQITGKQLDYILEHKKSQKRVRALRISPKFVRRKARIISSEEDLPVSSAKYEFNSKVNDLLSIGKEMLVDFDDLFTRLLLYTSLQRQLGDLLETARTLKSKELISAILTLYDAAHSVYSENLTNEQLEVLRKSAKQLQGASANRELVRALDRSLRHAGFETVPSDRSKYPQNA